jgi:biopolymer transport protein ExbD
MRILQASTRRKARLEIIPLIDIIFFLLATFVMVSMSMVKNQGISVKLPKAATGVSQERSVSATITVKENGDLFLNKEKMSSQELLRQLNSMKAKDPEQKVFVNGDELAYFGDVVMVLDQVRKAGLDKIAIQTKGAKDSAVPAVETSNGNTAA